MSAFRALKRCNCASVAMQFAVSLAVVAAVAGSAVEFAYGFGQHQRLQGALDGAALAGAEMFGMPDAERESAVRTMFQRQLRIGAEPRPVPRCPVRRRTHHRRRQSEVAGSSAAHHRHSLAVDRRALGRQYGGGGSSLHPDAGAQKEGFHLSQRQVRRTGRLRRAGQFHRRRRHISPTPIPPSTPPRSA